MSILVCFDLSVVTCKHHHRLTPGSFCQVFDMGAPLQNVYHLLDPVAVETLVTEVTAILISIY